MGYEYDDTGFHHGPRKGTAGGPEEPTATISSTDQMTMYVFSGMMPHRGTKGTWALTDMTMTVPLTRLFVIWTWALGPSLIPALSPPDLKHKRDILETSNFPH